MIHNHKNNKNKYKRYIFLRPLPRIPLSEKLKNVLFFFEMEKSNEENVIEEVIALELLCPFSPLDIFPFLMSYKLDDGSFFYLRYENNVFGGKCAC